MKGPDAYPRNRLHLGRASAAGTGGGCGKQEDKLVQPLPALLGQYHSDGHGHGRALLSGTSQRSLPYALTKVWPQWLEVFLAPGPPLSIRGVGRPLVAYQ